MGLKWCVDLKQATSAFEQQSQTEVPPEELLSGKNPLNVALTETLKNVEIWASSMHTLIRDLKIGSKPAVLAIFVESEQYCSTVNELLTARLAYGPQINTAGVY